MAEPPPAAQATNASPGTPAAAPSLHAQLSALSLSPAAASSPFTFTSPLSSSPAKDTSKSPTAPFVFTASPALASLTSQSAPSPEGKSALSFSPFSFLPATPPTAASPSANANPLVVDSMTAAPSLSPLASLSPSAPEKYVPAGKRGVGMQTVVTPPRAALPPTSQFFNSRWPTKAPNVAVLPTPLERSKMQLKGGATTLNIAMCDDELLELIKTSTSLLKLDLCSMLTPPQVECVCANSSITRLNLRSCGINDKAAVSLATMRSLKYLDVSCNPLSDATLGELLAAPIKELWAESLPSLTDGVSNGATVQQNTVMRNLYIGHNNIAAMCRYLPCKLQSLNVKMATVKSSDLAIAVAGLTSLTSLDAMHIPHTLELFKAVGEHPALVVVRMDVRDPTVLADAAAACLAHSKTIAYLRLNNYQVSEPCAVHLSQIEALTRLDIAFSGLDSKSLEHIMRAPYLRHLDISSCKTPSIAPIGTNTSLTALHVDHPFFTDLTPITTNTTLRRLSMRFALSRIGSDSIASLAKCTNLCRLDLQCGNEKLNPQPWSACTWLVYFKHPTFTTTGDQWNFASDYERVHDAVTTRHREAELAFIMCCMALGLERALPWEQRSRFGQLPLEVISHVMGQYAALWTRDFASRSAAAAFIITKSEKIRRLIRDRLPLSLVQMWRAHGRVTFKLAEAE